MLVPINWLKDYVDVNVGIDELTEKLTMSGSNVEDVKPLGKEIKNVVIGRVVKIDRHPDADKLLVTQVDVGDKVLQIVTGATNLKDNDKVPVALHGAVIHGGKKIRASKLRGIESNGMLCSAEELGLDDHGLPEEMKEGILVLPENAPIGEDIKNYIPLEDDVIDFEITPNRGDCLSIKGMAREFAATFNQKMKRFEITLKEEGSGEAAEWAKIRIEAEDLCKRYVARIITDVKIEPSPLWMQRRLQSGGVRPINNIVDITNYVMLELGQPLHAFDYDKIEGHEIIVRRAKSGEIIKTLDDVERELTDDILVIADKARAIGIAGVMGGADSEIKSSTYRILLESANFNGTNIRRTSKRLGLRSEASMRYEKGIDPNICQIAADRACQLIEQLGAGKVVRGFIDVYPNPVKPCKILLRPEKINKLLGTSISKDNMIEILKRLEIDVESTGDNLFALIPTFRMDLTREADLVEEIARIYGYDNLPVTLPKENVTLGRLNRDQKIVDEIKKTLTGLGYSEIYTFSFVSPKIFDKIKLPKDTALRKAISLLNPLGEDQSIMRTTLIPNMLDVITFNLNQKAEKVMLFESGTVYIPKELPLTELPIENKKLCLGLTGQSVNFYDLKQAIETIFARLRIKDYKFIPEKYPTYHPGRCAKITLGSSDLGIVGQIHPDVTESYDIKPEVYIAELDMDLLIKEAPDKIEFIPLPRFPASERDLAIVVKDDVMVGYMIETIIKTGGELLEKVEIFDVYKGGQIDTGYKSVAFSLKYRAADRNLTDTEVNELHEKIKEELVKTFDGRLRE